MTKSLTPIAHIFFTLLATLEAGISPVHHGFQFYGVCFLLAILSCNGALCLYQCPSSSWRKSPPRFTVVCIYETFNADGRSVTESYKLLINLFKRTQLFLQRLNHYTEVPLTPVTMALPAKVVAQVMFSSYRPRQ